jgi:Sortase domain
MIIGTVVSQHHPPRPTVAAGIEQTPRPASTSNQASGGYTKPAVGVTFPRLRNVQPDPVQITIKAIKVHARVMVLGLAADRTIQTPPLSQVGRAGWYRYSPTPGAVGPSVMLGHVDAIRYGKGVFFDLGAMRQGDVVSVLRTDHMVADFSVTRVAEYHKKSFPTQAVYGTTPNPQLRLITCGGRFDPHAHSYVDNIVVFATLTSLHHS